MAAKRIKTIKRAARPRLQNETARKVWLAGLGAVALAQKQGEKLVETLVAEGEQFQTRANKLATTLTRDVRRAANDVQKQVKGYVQPLRQRATRAVKQVESGLGERIGAVLGRFGVPSKSDVQELLGRVTELNKQVRTTSRKRAA